MSLCGFIEDGYTIDGMIPETDFHPELIFKFRPTTPTERAVYFDKSNCLKQEFPESHLENVENICNSMMAEKVVSWNLKKVDGSAVSINAENMGRLEPHLSASLFSVVFGNSPAQSVDMGKAAKN